MKDKKGELLEQKVTVAYIFSCIMSDEESLTLPVARKKIKSFLNKSQDIIDDKELLDWEKVENELIEMESEAFENWKKIALKYFNTQ